MKYKVLGTSDLSVSSICLGTMTFGEQNSKEEAWEQLDYAVENGVNFIDTAEMYSVPGRAETCGSTERIIGEWLKNSGKRNELILSTKVVGPSPGLKYIRQGPNFEREQVMDAVEGSLKNLKVDCVDLYQYHWPERENNRFGIRIYPFEKNEQWENNLLDRALTMNQLIKAGKIRHWGVSNDSAWGVMKYLQLCKENNLVPPVSIQNAYGLLNRQFEYAMSEVCQFEGIGLMAYSPLAFGALTGKYLEAQRPAGARLSKYSIFNRFLNPNAMAATKAFQKLAKDHQISLVQMALAFVRQQKFVGTTIIGATKIDQLKENIDSAEILLGTEVLSEIEIIFNQFPDAGL